MISFQESILLVYRLVCAEDYLEYTLCPVPFALYSTSFTVFPDNKHIEPLPISQTHWIFAYRPWEYNGRSSIFEYPHIQVH